MYPVPGICMYRLSSEYPEVRSFLKTLTPLVEDCSGELQAHHIGQALYGLQLMCSEHSEVRALVKVLAAKTARSRLAGSGGGGGGLGDQELGMACYGLKRMCASHKEVRAMLAALSEKTRQHNSDVCSGQTVGNTLFGLRGMSSQYHEVRELLSALAARFAASPDIQLSPQEIANVNSILQQKLNLEDLQN
jgi:hypothetical protein